MSMIADASFDDIPPIPSRVRTFDGQMIEKGSSLWRMRASSDGGDSITINWERLAAAPGECGFSARAVHLVRLYLTDRLRKRKSSTVHNDFYTFLYFEDWLWNHAGIRCFDWANLTEGLARSFLAHGVEHTAEKGNRFSRLRTFYEWGVARQHPDFSRVMLGILKTITAAGNAKGHHVRFRHPVRGPFSPDELLLIRRAVDAETGSEKDRAILMLHLELGHNPNATARLKNKDLIRYETKTAIRYQLDVPRVKKRTAHRETKRRPISNKLGALLERLRSGGPEGSLLHWLPTDSPENAVNATLRRFARSAGLVSPRTGQPLVMNARRFRFSIGTHMAEEGASIFHIAEILDHTDTQNVRVYVETVSSIADPVARATDAALIPLVNRFQGKVVSSTNLPAFQDMPKQLIPAIAPVFTRFLAARGVSRPLYYTPQTPRVEDFNRHTILGQQERRDRLPTDAALQGIADIYREHAKEPADRLRAAAVAILVVTGFRIGELLTLPFDCEVEEVRSGKPRYGIRYYKEKARGGAKMFAIRWLTATGAELARKAIHEIRNLTQVARARARVLEETPHRVPIADFHWSRRMTAADVTRVLGVQQVPDALHRHHGNRGVYYRTFEVEAFLFARRGRLWTVDRRDGTFQMLSETLLIAFPNFFHPGRAVFLPLVQPVCISQIADFLSGGGGTPSAFERFGIREPDGSFCRITSHQFRHWLNYIADKGGLPVDLQSRWMGREHSRDTEAYRHATVDERLQWVKDGIREGKLAGPKASMHFELPAANRNAYLDGEVQAVHFPALGVCLHEVAVTPCPYHLNCVRGCADYLRIKGRESERRRLIQIQQATEQALLSAQAFATGPGGSVAEPWIRHCEETLEGVRAALAVDDEVRSAEAIVAQPFYGQPSKFQKVSD